MADPRPVAQLYADGEITGKAAIRAYHDARLRVRLIDADELRAGDFSLVAGIEIDARAWDRVVGDTTSLDDGQWILVDAVGTRFARAINAGADFDAYGDAADRDDHDDEDAGFTFYAFDEEGWYVRIGDTPGTWSPLQPFRGPPGPSGEGAAENLDRTETAGAAISGHRAVAFDGGTVRHAGNTGADDADLFLGIALNAASETNPVTVRTAGVIVHGGWSWTPGAAIYLGTDGNLTETAPADPALFSLQIGSALAADTLLVRPSSAIFLPEP